MDAESRQKLSFMATKDADFHCLSAATGTPVHPNDK